MGEPQADFHHSQANTPWLLFGEPFQSALQDAAGMSTAPVGSLVQMQGCLLMVLRAPLLQHASDFLLSMYISTDLIELYD